MRLFISYCRKDADFAKKLAASLGDLGLDVWIDVEDIPVGIKWSSAVQQGLDTSQVMILVITPDSMASTNVEDEWQYFLDEHKPIIPVLLKPAKVHFQIKRLQYVNFNGEEYAAAFGRLCMALGANGVGVGVATIETKRPTSLEIMPPPFAWIDIPAGRVTLEAGGYVPEGGQIFEVPAFTIAKYPITNAQFGKFVEASGYSEQKWWTAEGWQGREREKWTEPRYWQESVWNQPDYPVVGVSWFEAVAFCLWLSDVTGERITLPTELQWQRAAQGDTNRRYPWGDEFDETKCNTFESGVGQTTPVDRYPGGASPYGLTDMIGNVWEWCLTDYYSATDLIIIKTNRRILRGGAWDRGRNSARAAYRGENIPHLWSRGVGFRVCVGVRPPSQ